jgi:hypothetical protein
MPGSILLARAARFALECLFDQAAIEMVEKVRTVQCRTVAFRLGISSTVAGVNLMDMSTLRLLCIALVLISLAGCTVFPEKNRPSLKTTTSAEQTERIFWRAAVKKDFATVTNLISAEAVFVERDGSSLTREQFLERLKAAPPVDYALGQVTVRPQGNEMLLTYPASVRQASQSVTVAVTILSVWQQTKNSGWTLLARSETPAPVSTR